MAITAGMVKELREMTGAGMMNKNYSPLLKQSLKEQAIQK